MDFKKDSRIAIYERIAYVDHLKNQAGGEVCKYPQVIELNPSCGCVEWLRWDKKNLPLLLSSTGTADDFFAWALKTVKEIRKAGVGIKVILGAEADSVIMSKLSPRFNHPEAQKVRQNFLDLLIQLNHEGLPIGVAICAEELCPGGWDLSDGLEFSQQIQAIGADFIVLSAGCEDFPALKHRRQTRQKKDRSDLNDLTVEPWLGSFMCLNSDISIPVWGMGSPNNLLDSLRLAKETGLSSLIVSK